MKKIGNNLKSYITGFVNGVAIHGLLKLRNTDLLQKYIAVDIDDYQKWTQSTAIYPKEKAIEYVSLGLSSEAGEVCGLMKKVIRDSDGVISDKIRDKITSELSDCIWYVARIADELGIKMSTIISYNMNKLEDRKARKVIKGSGDTR